MDRFSRKKSPVSFTDVDDLVRELVPGLLAVGIRDDRHRGDAFLFQDEEEPLGDLAPVRNEHLFERVESPARRRPGPVEEGVRAPELAESVLDFTDHGGASDDLAGMALFPSPPRAQSRVACSSR